MRTPLAVLAVLAVVLEVGSGPNRLLRVGLSVIAIAIVAWSLLNHLLFVYPFSVDLEIPLRAAQRWVDGGQPYLASAFSSPPGPTQPFLYPPFTLPFLAALLTVPETLLQFAWFLICLGCAVVAIRRLAFPWLWVPFALAWSPFAEPIIGGNIQVVLFLAFVVLFWRGVARTPEFRPVERDVAEPSESAGRLGILAALNGAFKASQVQPWLFLAHHRPVAATIGAGLIIAIIAVTLPITGIDPWFEWVRQLGRATDPTWDLGGIAIGRFAPPGVGLAITVLTSLAVLLLPIRPGAAAWIGVLSVWGTPSLHPFGLLFLVPAMILIRRELALVAATLIATTTYQGSWAGIVLVSLALLGSLRYPGLREPTRPLEGAPA
jgi:hypothetical protein